MTEEDQKETGVVVLEPTVLDGEDATGMFFRDWWSGSEEPSHTTYSLGQPEVENPDEVCSIYGWVRIREEDPWTRLKLADVRKGDIGNIHMAINLEDQEICLAKNSDGTIVGRGTWDIEQKEAQFRLGNAEHGKLIRMSDVTPETPFWPCPTCGRETQHEDNRLHTCTPCKRIWEEKGDGKLGTFGED